MDLKLFFISVCLQLGVIAILSSFVFLLLWIFYKYKKSINAKYSFRGAFLFLAVGVIAISISYYKFVEWSS